MDESEKINSSGESGGSDSGVQFEEAGWGAVKYYKEPTSPKVIHWVVKYSGGIIKDSKQANYAVLAFVALAILVSLFLVFGGNGKRVVPLPDPINPVSL